jgi:hypothetical protein
MVKVEKAKEDGEKKSKKNWKGCDVKALIALLGEMELELQCLFAHIVQLDFLEK